MDSQLIEILNEKTNNEYGFKLKSACLDDKADFCVIEILYRDGILLTRAKIEEFENIMLSELPKKYHYEFKFIKIYVTEESLKEEVEEYIRHNFPSIKFRLDEINKQDNVFKISLYIDELSFEFATNHDIKHQIEAFFAKKYEENQFNCEVFAEKIVKDDDFKTTPSSPKNVKEDERRVIEVTDKTEFIGDIIDSDASYIKDQVGEKESVVLCGKVMGIRQIILKPKPKQSSEEKPQEDKEEKKSKTPSGRKLYKWTLHDFTGDIVCSFLSNKQNQPKLDSLQNETEVLVSGNLVEDKYNGGYSLNVRSINLCKLPETFVEQICYQSELPYYEFVKPEKIVTYEQNNLLDIGQNEVPEFLIGKTFVCYDLETTGISYNNGDRMIELGAVKIENGKITENFESMVNPNGRHIDEGASATNGIFDMDVADALKDYQVLQDFYKFTRGATLIGYNNNGFDDIFLVGQGKSTRWNFDNPTMDVYKIARAQLRGLKNYKLETVAKTLGVVNEHAHRAWHDAMATAEVFIKLAKDMKNTPNS